MQLNVVSFSNMENMKVSGFMSRAVSKQSVRINAALGQYRQMTEFVI